MATELGSAYISVWPKLDGSQWASQINQALGNAGVSGGKKLGSGVSSGLSSAKIAIGNILANVASAGINAIRNSLDSAISRVDTLNNFPKVMSNIGFSTDEASSAVKKLGDGIDGLPTTLDGIVKNTQAFALSLGDLGKASDVALAVNDGMLAFGASSEGAAEAVRQLNQMITTGKYDMQSWNSINSAAPGMLDAVARSMLGESATASQLRDALNNGQISTEDFLDAVVKMDKEGGAGFASFAQLARESTGGIATSMANMRTAITKNLANIINAINGSGAISSLFDGFKSAINGIGTAILPLAEIVGQALSGIMTSFSDALKGFSDHCKLFADTFRSSFESTQNVAIAFFDGLERAFAGTGLENAFSVISNAVRAFCFSLQDGKPFIDAVKNALDEIPIKAQVVGGALAAIAGAAGLAKLGAEAGKAAKEVFTIGEKATAAASKLPVLGGAFGSLNSSMNGFHSSVTNAGGGLKGFTTALSTGLKAGVSGARNAMLNFATSTAMAGGGLKGVVTVIGSMLGPVGIAVASVAALVGVFALLYNTNDEFRESMNQLGSDLMASLQPALESVMQSFSQMASAIMPALTAVIQALIPVITTIMTTLANLAAAVLPVLAQLLASVLVPAITIVAQVIAAILPIIANIISLIAQVAATIISIVMPVIEAIIEVISAAMPVIQSAIEVAMSAILAIIKAVWPVIQSIIEVAMSVIQDVITIVMAAINGDWDGVWNGIKQLAADVWNGICTIISAAINAVLNIIQTILNTIANIWNAIWSAICNVATSIWNTIRSVVSSTISAVSGFISSALNTISSLWNSVWSAVSSFVSSTWSNVCSTVSSGVSSVISFIGSLPGKIMGFFANAGSWLINAGRRILEGLWNGMKAIWSSITGWLSNLGGIIASIKGPENYDKKLLIPAGKWIMGGLEEGLQTGFKSVKSELQSMTNDLSKFNTTVGIGVEADWRNMNSNDLLGSLGKAEAYLEANNLTRDDVYGAFRDALSSEDGQTNIYLDGQLVGSLLSPYMDQSLQVRAERRGRF